MRSATDPDPNNVPIVCCIINIESPLKVNTAIGAEKLKILIDSSATANFIHS